MSNDRRHFTSAKFTALKQPTSAFCQKGVLKNFTKFTGKYLCQSLFFNKVVRLRPETLSEGCNFIKKRLWHKCFLVNFQKYLRTLFDRTPPGNSFWKQNFLKLQLNSLQFAPSKTSFPKKEWSEESKKYKKHRNS